MALFNKQTQKTSHFLNRLIHYLLSLLEKYQLHLSNPNALISLSFLGFCTGLIAGLVIVLFRLLVEQGQALFLPPQSENYASLPEITRFLLPVTGSIVIAAIFYFFSKGSHILGVAGVIERMALHQGYLSFRTFVLQFFGAAIAIISGHSVGREGPNVFLGAASGSLLGQWFTLPNNSIRTLVGCGTAAGIAASFETPLAGVIFALEVVMMEYTLATFLPIILAAGSATSVAIYFFGSEPAFIIPLLYSAKLIELPLVIFLGLLAGVLSALLIHVLHVVVLHSKHMMLTHKLILAGVLVGFIAMMIPGVMGIGYETVNQLLAGKLALDIVMLLLICKFLATVASIGLAIPGGVIGPALFLGSSLGAAFALLMRMLFPELNIDVGFYSLLGLGAVMGASLQAPLAALTAMMELTHSPQIIMPGMIAIVVANLTASEFFQKKSLFLSVLDSHDYNHYINPVTQKLRRIGVAGIMEKGVVQTDAIIERRQADRLLKNNPQWLLIINHENEQIRQRLLMPAVDLLKYLEAEPSHDQTENDNESVNLLDIPAKRLEAESIYVQATLEEALVKLDKHKLDTLYVERMNIPGIVHIYGVLTRSDIESSYQIKRNNKD